MKKKKIHISLISDQNYLIHVLKLKPQMTNFKKINLT